MPRISWRPDLILASSVLGVALMMLALALGAPAQAGARRRSLVQTRLCVLDGWQTNRLRTSPGHVLPLTLWQCEGTSHLQTLAELNSLGWRAVSAMAYSGNEQIVLVVQRTLP